jgi:NTP pyrophosphatase (non-canonical NTP hydrolase)
MTPSRDISRLLEIMAALRDPETGCPWDVEQTFSTISPYTIEEAYEVADAIERDDMVDLPDELGDLLLQVVFHSRMAEEAGHFDFGDVVEAITSKMIRRHPHVFGDETVRGRKLAKGAWERIKAAEKAEKAARHVAAPAGAGAGATALPCSTTFRARCPRSSGPSSFSAKKISTGLSHCPDNPSRDVGSRGVESGCTHSTGKGLSSVTRTNCLRSSPN